eukprot:CAMPEP_0197288194 /NCGR_PEP_ID=MMETSP0890-20130614/5185_1 /TAXON_ID=44058 ORGANISM="Aureoumbra lagunensis, Strain CCMP1510" /NCGR_SAMPLE_ID=MMETSP0890 /ASSEMBLY_ACC=CAM_ASM_000533 /LENGTH=268 /DNA_ID=CAMNT_0042758709 /DNA_START=206 /DNA_END=1012 /DNA_ORIENTATION=+
MTGGIREIAKWKVENTIISASVGSVVDFEGDAIVNAANIGCITGGGVDGAISKAGGLALHNARIALPILRDEYVRCETGDAKITVGGELKAKFCIHAVGPDYRIIKDKKQADDLLSSAYLAALAKAKENEHIKSLAFPLLSSGIFRGDRSLNSVLEIAARVVVENVDQGIEIVHLVAFADAERDALLAALTKVLGPPSLNFEGKPTAKLFQKQGYSSTVPNQQVVPPLVANAVPPPQQEKEEDAVAIANNSTTVVAEEEDDNTTTIPK